MDLYSVIKTVHILSATVLFGTGLGIAFFMFCSVFAKNMHERYYAARFTVLADYLFTAPAVVLQPLTGFWLVRQSGLDLQASWLQWTFALYALAGLCWLPVVWIQIQLRRMVAHAVFTGMPLPPRYNKLFRLWLCLGWPAFGALLGIFYLMVTKPA